jgi:hypothetical protein
VQVPKQVLQVPQAQKLNYSALNTRRWNKTKRLRLAEQKQASYEPSFKKTLPGQPREGGFGKAPS